MCFKFSINNNKRFPLTRYATNYNYKLYNFNSILGFNNNKVDEMFFTNLARNKVWGKFLSDKFDKANKCKFKEVYMIRSNQQFVNRCNLF